ncbi:hypothetical protein [Umezawaea sp. NPDC059074]|uniref:hypothetical protein n=1 Tax=Umezawaea sp. NPDC059074 TaxID=3346716 RepID=UPI0036C8198F
MTLVASGTSPTPLPEDLAVDDLDGFIRRIATSPSWILDSSGIQDSNYYLTLAVRRRRLIALHTEPSLRDHVKRWITKPPRPPLRKLPPAVFEAGLLQGEAKGLLLRGTHSRRTTRPDSKNLSGLRLQDALNALEDSSFALSSGRAAFPEGTAYPSLTGTVSTTPGSSQVWHKPNRVFTEFIATVCDVLDLLESLLSEDDLPASAFPQLARPTTDLAELQGPYEVVPLAPEDIVGTPDFDPDRYNAAVLLDRAMLTVHPGRTPTCFSLDVGFNDSASGTLTCKLVARDDSLALSFGYGKNITDHRAVERIFHALNDHPDLLTVYFESGHTYVEGQVWQRETRVARFPNWEFEDFSVYAIKTEKPGGKSAQAIHDAIGVSGDDSLFAWVVAHYSTGWLTCDDGPGEIADFLHLSDEGVLTAIHVKAAKSLSPRGIAATAYEVVSSQATKNLVFADTARLKERLLNAPAKSPATWVDGTRCADRSEFIDMLDARRAQDEFRVVIVQPQVAENLYSKISDSSRKVDRNTLQLYRLETLLNGARGSIVAMGGDLTVIGRRG